MTTIFAVFLGGGIGAVARYGLSGAVHRWLGIGFPYGTMAVNLTGSFLIGIMLILLEGRFLFNPVVRTFLIVGIIGGFTTFSAFSFETIALLRGAQFGAAAINIIASVVGCLSATFLGSIVARSL